ncbi:unnamed protein product, partial [Pylaiella littoralis]
TRVRASFDRPSLHSRGSRQGLRALPRTDRSERQNKETAGDLRISGRPSRGDELER